MTVLRRLLPVTLLIVLAVPATARGQETTAICHATGNPNSPYVLIQVAPEATLEHLQHDEDLVPAPAGGCPAQLVVDEEDPVDPAPTPTPTPTPTPAATPQADVIPPRARPRRPRPRRRQAPARRRAAPRAQAAPAAAAGNVGATATVKSDTLPMTGAEIPAIALTGLGFLLAGAGLRLRYDGW